MSARALISTCFSMVVDIELPLSLEMPITRPTSAPDGGNFAGATNGCLEGSAQPDAVNGVLVRH